MSKKAIKSGSVDIFHRDKDGWGCPACGCPTAVTVGEVEFTAEGSVDFDELSREGYSGWKNASIHCATDDLETTHSGERLCCEHCGEEYTIPALWEGDHLRHPPLHLELLVVCPSFDESDRLCLIPLDDKLQQLVQDVLLADGDYGDVHVSRVMSDEALDLIRSHVAFVLSSELAAIKQKKEK